MFWDYVFSHWPPIVYGFMAISVGVVPYFLSYLLHFYQKKYSSRSLSPYECGFEPIETQQANFHISFYAVALSFIVFDLEMLFLIPWACSLQQHQSFDILIGGLLFLCFLLVGLYYEYDQGVLGHDTNT